jgi:hypothetical protein
MFYIVVLILHLTFLKSSETKINRAALFSRKTTLVIRFQVVTTLKICDFETLSPWEIFLGTFLLLQKVSTIISLNTYMDIFYKMFSLSIPDTHIPVTK